MVSVYAGLGAVAAQAAPKLVATDADALCQAEAERLRGRSSPLTSLVGPNEDYWMVAAVIPEAELNETTQAITSFALNHAFTASGLPAVGGMLMLFSTRVQTWLHGGVAIRGSLYVNAHGVIFIPGLEARWMYNDSIYIHVPKREITRAVATRSGWEMTLWPMGDNVRVHGRGGFLALQALSPYEIVGAVNGLAPRR